jgi:putative ABC transport system ATP-binding protein
MSQAISTPRSAESADQSAQAVVLEAREVRKTFGSDGVEVHALAGVSLAVPKGQFLAIMGPSGSGKSTLLYVLGGIEAPSSGQVLVDGEDLVTLGDDGRTLIRRREIGFVFQAFNLLPTLTVSENVALPLLLDGTQGGEAEKRSAEVLTLVNMTHRRDHLPQQLSGGEQQRVAIARALVIRPSLVLADEPTGNLDSANGEQVVSLLRDLVDRHEQTVVMVTHDAAVASRADRIVRLRDGHIEFDGPPDSLHSGL